ncbi:NAD(P)/FAD-dependent oxidoreductase [Frankia sp. CiP3]|uniref:NAD(P)/FAD-dependent oxidoreductase n=1 Tax=Frankia sp. CiP3 TaxID=2880971 RepID=UPI001EF580B7|nr:NAD(P)/FAD-dependent oxidoreductase [Frankia sp. CiP3]
MTERFDVVVVGARCAGSPLGALLARRGLKVAVLEQVTFPRPTLSSHVMQADSLAFLNRLGVIDQVRATGAPFMSRCDVRLDDFRFTAGFPLHLGDVGGAAAVRRHLLDPILADAAADAGADVRLGTRVTALVTEGGRVVGVRALRDGSESEIRAGLVVGADGRDSTVARMTGARRYNVTESERVYYWTYFEGANLGAAPTFVFHRWGDRHIFSGPADSGLYLVGVSPREHEVEMFRRDLAGSLMAHVNSCAPIADTLRDAKRATKIYGILRFEGYFREASGPGWVLAGDAGHFKDPAAGRGIGDAFHQVETLAPMIESGLATSRAALDSAMGDFVRWRDKQYSSYYWMAADFGRLGAVPAVLPAVTRRLHDSGQINRLLEMFAHRVSPAELLTPGRLVGGVAAVLAGASGRRGPAVREIASLLATEARRRRLNKRPVFAVTAANRAGRGLRSGQPDPDARLEWELTP